MSKKPRAKKKKKRVFLARIGREVWASIVLVITGLIVALVSVWYFSPSLSAEFANTLLTQSLLQRPDSFGVQIELTAVTDGCKISRIWYLQKGTNVDNYDERLAMRMHVLIRNRGHATAREILLAAIKTPRGADSAGVDVTPNVEGAYSTRFTPSGETVDEARLTALPARDSAVVTFWWILKKDVASRAARFVTTQTKIVTATSADRGSFIDALQLAPALDVLKAEAARSGENVVFGTLPVRSTPGHNATFNALVGSQLGVQGCFDPTSVRIGPPKA